LRGPLIVRMREFPDLRLMDNQAMDLIEQA
jgi:hypothetical protein